MSSPEELRERALHQSPFAVRIVQRRTGRAAIIYRRLADPQGRDRLQRVGALAPLAFSAALGMLQEGIAQASPHANGARNALLPPGLYLPLDAIWGARLGCFAILASGLRDGARLLRAAQHMREADAAQAAWWLGLLRQKDSTRALRALRILTEAVA